MDNEKYTGNRTEKYSWWLLDQKDQPIREIKTIKTGHLEYNVNAKIRGGGTVTLTEPLPWLTHRIQPIAQINNETIPLGVYIFATPREQHTDNETTWTVDLLDKLTILDTDRLPYTYTTPEGKNVTDEITQILQRTGEKNHAITPTTKTLTTPMTWPAGTSKLQIINDLLNTINYFSLDLNGTGTYTAEPYQPPKNRETTYNFQPGQYAIHTPNWAHNQDIANVPNRIILIGQGTPETPGPIGTAENNDPRSPFSFQARGRWITETEDGVDVVDQKTIDALAARKLEAASSPVSVLEVEHALIPLRGNDVVRFRDRLAVVQRWAIDTTPGALVSGTWREVSQ